MSPTDPGTVRVGWDSSAVTRLPLSQAPSLVRLAGRAVDAQGGPVADLPVAVHETADVSRAQSTTTDADGHWSFRVRPDRDLAVSVGTPASGDDYDPVQQVNALYEPTLLAEHSPLTGVLRTGAVAVDPARDETISGRVLRADGSPVARATVRVWPTFGTRWGLYTWQDAETDDEGRFSAPVASGIAYELTVHDLPGNSSAEAIEGWAAAPDADRNERYVVDGGPVDVGDLDVGGGFGGGTRSISGTVSSPDGPAADVEVSLYEWRAGSPQVALGQETPVVRTDALGHYSFDDLPDGWWGVLVSLGDQRRGLTWFGGHRPTSLSDAGTVSTVGGDAVADVQVRSVTGTRLEATAGRPGIARLVAHVTVTTPVGEVGAPQGTVRFLVDGRSVGTADLDQDADQDGVARLRVPDLDAGRHLVRARYLGDDSTGASTSGVERVTTS
ncbi:hypothetical protein E8D37_19560 [Nocardioides sp. GY 10127]|nr:hypothetical protein E8D37_19560 [Nocardioides sp. GY 10127]